VPVGLPDTAGGAVELYVEGLLNGAVAAGGTLDLNINIGQRPHLTVDIEPNAPVPDLASPPDMAGPAILTACADAAHARCARVAACSTGSPSYLLRFWGDQGTCETRIKLECESEAGAPGSLLDGAAIERCAAGYAGQICADRFAGYKPPACLSNGSRSNGMGCFFDTQCSSGFCNLPGGSSCGSCAAQTVAGTSSCTVNSDCAGREVCAGGFCQVRSGLNLACSATRPCDEELSCVSGACKQDVATSGATCDTTGTTAANCDGDLALYCNASNKCADAAAATISMPACGTVSGVRTYCTNGARLLRQRL